MSKKFQTVGSLLRPAELLAFKDKIQKTEDAHYPFYDEFPGFKEAEDKAVADIVKKEEEHGLVVLTDGEMTKSLWHTDFVWGLQGVERHIEDHGYFFCDLDGKSSYETRKDIGVKIVGRLSGKNHHFIDIFKNLKKVAGPDRTVKLTVPSASHIFGEQASLGDENIGEDHFYKNLQDFKADLVRSYKEFLEEYAAAGGEIIQFDDCLWELFADDNPNSPFTGQGIDPEAVKANAQEFVDINNEVIDFGHGLGLKVWTHNCRGNYDSRNMGGGSYLKIAGFFLKQQRYDRFFLEWDDERAGSLEALKAFEGRDVEVVLGLLSSKSRELDDEERVVRLLDEASTIIPKEKLFLSHQCGFASCDGGNDLTEEEEWAKIDQGQAIALKYWGE